MHDFELSLEDGYPTNIYAFIVNFNFSPPKMSGKTLNVDHYIPKNKLVKSVPFKEAETHEGNLNIVSCRFENGKCFVYFFGILKETVVKWKMEFKIQTLRDFDLLNEKINFILAKSKSILMSYYNQSKPKNIEHHLVAFLTDNQTA
jgi:hypothetical protein